VSELIIRVFDVEHGACTIMMAPGGGRIAMIDSGDNSTTRWRPSTYIRDVLERTELDYLFVTNADQDHLSDLEGLWQEGVNVRTLIRNPSITPQQLRKIKEEQGECTNDVERFLGIHASYVEPAQVPFEAGMGGVSASWFWCKYPYFTDTNNLSLVVFIKFGAFKMLFPGDLEKPGWLALARNPGFRAELQGTTIMMASHHGRETGFSEEIFRYFTPHAVVISDKPIAHETQKTVPDYRGVVQESGVKVVNHPTRRHVLTTRRDGDIVFKVQANGDYLITTPG